MRKVLLTFVAVLASGSSIYAQDVSSGTTPVTAIQNPGTPNSAAAVADPQARQAREALLSGQAQPQPDKWSKLDEGAKDFANKEIKEHVQRAREAYMLKNYSQASDEIQRADALMAVQEAALNAARQDIARLAHDAQNGRLSSGDQIEQRFQEAMNYPNRLQNEMPVGPALSAALRDEPRYHFDMARSLFAKKDYNGASQEIETGTQYLKMQADEAYGQKKVALQDSINRLSQVSKNVKSGTADSMAQLDQAIAGAERALNTPA